MTSTIHSADYLCLSGFELYGSLLLAPPAVVPPPVLITSATDAALQTARREEYSAWSLFASNLNLHESSMSWLMGCQQLGLQLDPQANAVPVSAQSSKPHITLTHPFQLRRRAHRPCVAEIHVAMLPWLWMMLRAVKSSHAVARMLTSREADGSGLAVAHWVALLLPLAQPSLAATVRFPGLRPSDQADGGARLVRLLSLRILRVLLPLLSPSTPIALPPSLVGAAGDLSVSSSALPFRVDRMLSAILQVVGSLSCPKSILSLLNSSTAPAPGSSSARASHRRFTHRFQGCGLWQYLWPTILRHLMNREIGLRSMAHLSLI